MRYFRESTERTHDVVILGAGLVGSMLGAILARHGVRVLILDGFSHPRFAIGESTIPLSTLFIEFLAARFSVPELLALADPAEYHKHIGTTCGVKGNFGYVYHRQGTPQRADQAQQLGVSREFRHDEVHFFRQDVDAYLTHVANRYGAIVRQDVKITDVAIHDDGVVVTSAAGERFRGKYVVDSTGYRSVLARKLALREEPTTLRHHSRSIFTHMLRVKPYDEVNDALAYHGLPTRWFEGTLHHVFDGGWLWVIPFNNMPGSNPLCSVGLNLDPRRYPRTSKTPEEEFAEFLDRFPDVARQFEGALPAREWVATDRLQYSSKQSVGDRWCLMSHASGFVDPFYSRGMISAMEVIQSFVRRIFEALQDGDFSRARFAPVEDLQEKLLRHNDELVNCSYISFRDYELWNAFLRVWVLGTYAAEAAVVRLFRGYNGTDDASVLEMFDAPVCPGLVYPFGTWYRDLFRRAADLVYAVERGELEPSAAASQIFRAMRETNYEGSWWTDDIARDVFRHITTPDLRAMFYLPPGVTRVRDYG